MHIQETISNYMNKQFNQTQHYMQIEEQSFIQKKGSTISLQSVITQPCYLQYKIVREASHNLTAQQVNSLKQKQQKNIINKIQRIVQKVVPIHEQDDESDRENDMTDLIEDLDRMEIQ